MTVVKLGVGSTHAGAVAGVVADGVFAGAVDVAEGEGLGEKCYTFAVCEGGWEHSVYPESGQRRELFNLVQGA